MIFLDTNVVSETLRAQPDLSVMKWLVRHDAELALSTVAMAELAYGIAKVRPDQRALRLQRGLDQWRARFAGRIFAFTEESALVYGEFMGESARNGRSVSAPDGMIAAIAKVHGSPLATRNIGDFSQAGVPLVNPWE